MKTRDTVTLLAMLEITGAYTGKALVIYIYYVIVIRTMDTSGLPDTCM